MLRFKLFSVARFATSVTVSLLAATSYLSAQNSSPDHGSLTASQVIDRIAKATGATLPANTVDTIKAGDPATVVTGIVTTFTPSMDVLRKAVAAGDNLIVTHEPTFYNHLDDPTLFVEDAVYKEK